MNNIEKIFYRKYTVMNKVNFYLYLKNYKIKR